MVGKKCEYQPRRRGFSKTLAGERSLGRSLAPGGGEPGADAWGSIFPKSGSSGEDPGFLGSLLPTVVPISVRLYKSGVGRPNKKEKPGRREC